MALNQNKFRERVSVFAPATVANLVCGFDILGLALDEPGDKVHLQRTEKTGLHIREIIGDDGKLSTSPSKNTVSVSIQAFLDHLGINDMGLEITLHKMMPIGSGLGSSAASAVAGVFAANLLLGSPLTAPELLPFAMQGEAMACGDAHADNVAPSLLGGITLIRSYEPLDVVSLPVPDDLYVAVLYPHVNVPTSEARKMIKQQIPLKHAVQQWGNVAGLVAALYSRDYDLLGRSMQDLVAEPVRSLMIPEFSALKQLALEKGALGFGISGSGPSVFSFARSRSTAQSILDAQNIHLEQFSVQSSSYLSKINTQGPYEIL